MFNLKIQTKPDIHRKEINGKRHYVCEGMVYPSVTTVIGQYYDKSSLERWRDRIGHDNANAITYRAGTRGTRLHGICEKYLLNEQEYLRGEMPTAMSDFYQVKGLLDENVEEIYGVEFPLYSHRLQVAGTTDLICKWNGIKSIVDFKTSRKEKKEEWIENYFVQSSAYAIMVNELFELDIEQVVIIVLPENAPVTTFLRKKQDYETQVNDVFINRRPAGLDAFRYTD